MPYSLLSDTELWNLFLKGDKKALAYIYKKQYRLLLAYGIKLCNDPELVRDCIQDLFVKLHTNRSNLSETININTYLICALKQRLFKEVSSSVQMETIEDFLFDFTADEEFFDRFVDNDEEWMQKKKLEKAIKLLSSRQKEAIYLRFIRDLSYEEIGEVLGINYQSSKNLVSRTLIKLREFYLSL